MFKLFHISIAVAASLMCVTECCLELWNNQCTNDLDCCSGFCFMGDGWALGVCKPLNSPSQPQSQPIAGKLPAGKCLELWNNQCTTNSDCCSEFCFMGNGWAVGVCKPLNSPSQPSQPQPQPQSQHQPQAQYQPQPLPQPQHQPQPQPQYQHQPQAQPQYQPLPPPQPQHQPQPQPQYQPQPLPLPQAQPQSQHQPQAQPQYQPLPQSEYQPQPLPQPQSQPQPIAGRLPAGKCLELWNNQCTTNSDCCSGFCFMGNGWAVGVCKPLNSPSQPSQPQSQHQSQSQPNTGKLPTGNCHGLWYNHCTEDPDCCSGFCYLGPGNSWREGVCKLNEGNRLRK